LSIFKRFILGCVVFALLFGCFSLAVFASKENKKNDLYKQVELFSDTLAIIQEDYVDEAKPKDLIYGALKGMLSSLDPHSQFLDPDTYNELKIDTEGKFGGLGIEITIKDGMLTIITPIEDTPAWRAGIKSGDRIVKINDELTREMTLTDAVKKMRGKPGVVIKLSVLRESDKKILDFSIKRDLIKIKDVKNVQILEDGIGYIRLTEFRENTSQQFNAAITSLSKQKMNALILDLRNNPGGLLEEAARITGKFIPQGKLIAYTKSRKTSQDVRFTSLVKNPILNLPLVILINEGSASGSEVVAACLQDYKRAMIIGTKSFGKGSVQAIIPLGDGSALKLTTSKYFTPSGKVIHGNGVVPDIIVEALDPAARKKEDAALSGGKAGSLTELEEVDAKNEVLPTVFNYKTDKQIQGAISALKSQLFYKNSVKNQ
jgi:carboxyl-terminal processing protease